MGNTISYNTKETVIDLGPKGKIKGLQYDDKAVRYAGVPYALPPTGEHRWRKPRPLPPSYAYSGSEGSYDATSFRPPCAQGAQVHGAAPKSGSEDCLIVNIWTPVKKPEDPNKKWPVMIWIHGGWFQIGNPSQDIDMDPTELVGTSGLDAIFVAVGYRLNIFGFLATQALADENGGEAAGNFGLWDQRIAIEWVYENIGSFGGDVNNITLSGRSAGAYSVEAQTLYEFRKKNKDGPAEHFHRIFMTSNAIPAQPKTITETEGQFDEVCQYLGIDLGLSGTERLAKLRQVSQETLLAAIPKLNNHTFRPVTDDVFFHSGMVEYLRDGGFAAEFKKRGMKLLIGEVLNEDKLYAQFNAPKQGNIEALRLQTSNYYAPATTDRVIEQYKLPEGTDLDEWKAVFGNIIADGQVRAPGRFFVDNLHKHGVSVSDIWRYQIGYRLSFIPEKLAPLSYGVTHAMDKSYWNYSIHHGPTAEEKAMMSEWIGNLVAFVQNDKEFDFGTRQIEQHKIVSPDMKIEVVTDGGFKELSALGSDFAQG
ncbi:hypothetical protein NW767_010790 [Fusarium falciforme]|nr:hypothetical protein NW767_010790 [Fusarium falciforme]